jgi:hypothetical protein
MVLDMLDQFPHLAMHRHVWEKIVQDSDDVIDFGVLDLILDRCPFLHDRDFMFRICKQQKYSQVLRQFVPTDLIQNREFLQDVLQGNPQSIVFLPRLGQSLFPDLIIQSIEAFGKDKSACFTMEKVGNLACNLIPELWNDRSMVLRWCTAGLPFPSSDWYYYDENGSLIVPRPWEQWNDDEEMFLSIAKHCRFCNRTNLAPFQEASPALLGSKAFMLRAVEIDARTYRYASRELQNDFDLALLVFANLQNTCRQTFAPFTFRQQIRNQLDEHQSFLRGFLHGISSATEPSALSLLNEC